MKSFVFAAALLSVSASAALAADAAPMAYDWTGLYAGVNAGYAFAGDDKVAVNGVPAGDLNINGMFGGVQLGYNHQVNNVVLGVETDFQGSGISYSTIGAKDNLNWFGTLRGRAGFAADRAMFYATGGLAYGGGTYKELISSSKDSYGRVGWTVGGGVEYAMTDSLSVKGEYLYANFGRFNVGGTKATPDFHSVRLGINFKF